jgi:hypothetical protein
MPEFVSVSAFTKRRYMAFPSSRPDTYLQIKARIFIKV